MYQEYFGLNELPFSIAPDPRYLYMSERHREALAHLLFGVHGQGGFVVLTGEVGTGKTTICRCFLQQLPEKTDVAFVVNPALSVRELLGSICDELGIEYARSASVKSLNDAINTYLLSAHATDRHTVVLIDEAQNLSTEVLEQLRLLTNLETSEKKLLQIILLGQPELKELLATRELRQLAQRVTARYHLDALNKDDVKAYLRYRLSVAGRRTTVFSDSAIRRIYKISKGIPRLINLLADRSMLGAYAAHSAVVTPYHVAQAKKEIYADPSPDEVMQKRKRWRLFLWTLAVADVLLIVILVYQFFYKNTSLTEMAEIIEDPGSQHELRVDPISNESARNKQVNIEQADNKQADNEQAYIDSFEQALSQTEAKVLAYKSAESPVSSIDRAAPGATVSDEGSDENVEGDAFHFLRTLGSQAPIDGSRYFAFKQLLKSWEVFYPKEPFMLACQFAQLNDLRCIHKQGNWRSLLSLDRPAVLSLFNDQGQKFYVALLKVEGQEALLGYGEETFWVTLDEVDRYWLGEYSLVFRRPPFIASVGDNDEVREQWLREQFALMQYSGDFPRFNLDPESTDVTELLKAFQRTVGIAPDGVAGSMTYIHLNTINKAESPRLLGRER